MRSEDNPVLETIRLRRSVRAYLNRQIPPAVEQEILQAGRCAPNAWDRQSFVLCKVGPDARGALVNECLEKGVLVLTAGTAAIRLLPGACSSNRRNTCPSPQATSIPSLPVRTTVPGALVVVSPVSTEANTFTGSLEKMSVEVAGHGTSPRT